MGHLRLPLEKFEDWLHPLPGAHDQAEEQHAITGSVCFSLRAKGAKRQRHFLSMFETFYDKVSVMAGSYTAVWPVQSPI